MNPCVVNVSRLLPRLLLNLQFPSTSVLACKNPQNCFNNSGVGFSIQFKGDRLDQCAEPFDWNLGNVISKR